MTVVATCGCHLASSSLGTTVEYDTEDCDAVDGWQPCTVTAFLCWPCVAKYSEWYPGLRVLPDTSSAGAP